LLYGRHAECDLLDRLLTEVRIGHSRALVVLGEAGVGKTALLDYLVESAADLRVNRAVGVESEMELPFAGLHLLCGPMLDRLGRLPGPQRVALATTFGLETGPVPDRFLVGLAVLSLLSEAAAERPAVCVVDDAQWLDRESAQALAFAARRLRAESVLMVFAARERLTDLSALPELMVEGLRDPDARELLDSVLRWPLDERVRERVVAETRGNPLALRELPRGLSPAQLAGGFGLPGVVALPGRIEDSFLRRIEGLPSEVRQLLALAAADQSADPALVWRAAGLLGLRPQAADQADGLIEIGAQVRFRHPLVRSAAYRAASPHGRQAVHRALAAATDPRADPDRRAWHGAQAAAGPDEEVAGELERSADRAQARGGLAAAAAFLERAAFLTPGPGDRAKRLLVAARAKHEAGAPDEALGLLVAAEAVPLDALQSAECERLRGRVAHYQRRDGAAAGLLLSAAQRLEPLDASLAREAHLESLLAAMWGSDLGCPAPGARRPRPHAPPRQVLNRSGLSTFCSTRSRCG
jgi:AAA ATPase domain